MDLIFLQNYWWLIISVLGGILVFLLFVQGGQAMLFSAPDSQAVELIVKSIGRKWELTYTTLVLFGGAMFASFPLYYSTSFGGAYWLWILILLGFVVQAVSYEYRAKPGNILTRRGYDILLFCNGTFGTLLLGEAVGMFFFGADFTVQGTNLISSQTPVISQWNPSHGLDVIINWKNFLLGLTVLMLSRTLATLYLRNSVAYYEDFNRWLQRMLWYNSTIFIVVFLSFLAVLFTSPGFTVLNLGTAGFAGDTTAVVQMPFKFWHNLISSPSILVLLVVGVANVLLGVIYSLVNPKWNQGIWYAGIGVFFTVTALLWLVGFNDTPILASNIDPDSSLTIHNASSSEFTLRAMAWVSLAVPVVIAYIWYVWRKIDQKKITHAD